MAGCPSCCKAVRLLLFAFRCAIFVHRGVDANLRSKRFVRRDLQSAFVPYAVQQSQQDAGSSSYTTDAAAWLGNGDISSSLWIVGNRISVAGGLPECFAIRILLDGTPWSLDNQSTQYLNSSGFWEACTSISLGMSPEAGMGAKATVAGYSQRSSLLVNSSVPFKGFIVDAFPVFGSDLLPLLDNTENSNPTNVLTVPVASASSGDISSTEGETTWIVSIDVEPNDSTLGTFAIASGSMDSGISSTFSVHRWNRNTMQRNGLIRSFFGSRNGMPVSIQPSGILVLRNGGIVIVAGSTSAEGATFGTKLFGSGTDLDGFVLKLEGERVVPWGGTASTKVYESVNGQDDRVEAICANEAVDPDFFYVLGSTEGVIEDSADPILLSKVSVETLQRVWTTRLTVNGEAHGKSCSVSHDGAEIYMAGILYNGASLATETTNGGHDIFVAKAETQSGSLLWARQIGSTANDAVSTIVPNENDNGAIIVGNSLGSWYRAKADNSEDLIIFSMSRDDGSYLPLMSGFIDPAVTPVAAPFIAAPATAPVIAPTPPIPAPVIAPTPPIPAQMVAPTSTPFTAVVMAPDLAPTPATALVSAPTPAPVVPSLSMPVVPPTLVPIMAPLSVPASNETLTPPPSTSMNTSSSVASTTSSPFFSPTTIPLMVNQVPVASPIDPNLVNAASPTSAGRLHESLMGLGRLGGPTLVALTTVLGITLW